MAVHGLEARLRSVVFALRTATNCDDANRNGALAAVSAIEAFGRRDAYQRGNRMPASRSLIERM
jgi:hypothetical protein